MRVKDEDKIARIFDATIALSNEVGIEGLTIAKIANLAGLASGTVYIYFKGKEELLNKLYETLKQQGTSAAVEILPDQPIRPQLAAIWSAVFRYRVENHREIRFLELFTASSLMAEKNRALSRNFKLLIEEFLTRGKVLGEIAEVPNLILYSVLTGSMKELTQAYVVASPPLGEDFIAASFEPVWRAIERK